MLNKLVSNFKKNRRTHQQIEYWENIKHQYETLMLLALHMQSMRRGKDTIGQMEQMELTFAYQLGLRRISMILEDLYNES